MTVHRSQSAGWNAPSPASQTAEGWTRRIQKCYIYSNVQLVGNKCLHLHWLTNKLKYTLQELKLLRSELGRSIKMWRSHFLWTSQPRVLKGKSSRVSEFMTEILSSGKCLKRGGNVKNVSSFLVCRNLCANVPLSHRTFVLWTCEVLLFALNHNLHARPLRLCTFLSTYLITCLSLQSQSQLVE